MRSCIELLVNIGEEYMSVDQYRLCVKPPFDENLAPEIFSLAPTVRQALFILNYNEPTYFLQRVSRERESGATSRLAFAGLMQEWLDAEVPLLSKTGVGLKNL